MNCSLRYLAKRRGLKLASLLEVSFFPMTLADTLNSKIISIFRKGLYWGEAPEGPYWLFSDFQRWNITSLISLFLTKRRRLCWKDEEEDHRKGRRTAVTAMRSFGLTSVNGVKPTTQRKASLKCAPLATNSTSQSIKRPTRRSVTRSRQLSLHALVSVLEENTLILRCGRLVGDCFGIKILLACSAYLLS